MSFSQAWLDEVKAKYLQGESPGEDLRYDDDFIQLKTENNAVSPDADWMIKTSAHLLTQSADLRVCIYALHAISIRGEADSFVRVLEYYAELINHRFEVTYPEGKPQKLATFEWCSKSFIVDLLKTHQSRFTANHLSQIQSSLTMLHQSIEKHAGEVIKWRALLDWSEQGGDIQTKVKPVETQIKEEIPQVENAKDAKPFFDKMIETLLKEEQYERAVGLSRAYRWAELNIPEHSNQKTRLEIRQDAIENIKSLVKEKKWKEVLHACESLFSEPHAQFYFTLNHWSYQALIHLGYPAAAETILLLLKKLYKNDGQLFSLMYNGGQLFCESETLAWIEQQLQERSNTSSSSQNNILQLIKEQDVENMKNWLHERPITTKIEAYVRDLIHLTLLKHNSKDYSLVGTADALFERSIDEGLHAWDPELARVIWQFYAGLLKEEKQQHNNNPSSKTLWQAKWDRFSNMVARSHLPAALEIMKYV